MKTILTLVFLHCFCLAAYGSDEQDFFKTFQSTYTLKREGAIVGEIKRTLSKTEDGYSLRSDTKTTGLVALFYKNTVNEHTRWQMQGDELRPLEYSYFRDKNGQQRVVNIDFNWDTKRIITHAEGTHWSMELGPEIYDKLLYELVIVRRLQTNQTINEIKVADGGQLKTYSFKHLGQETITTPLGKLETVKLARHKSNSDKVLTVWYAIDMNYLPIKVENIDGDGKTVTAVINQIDFQ